MASKKSSGTSETSKGVGKAANKEQVAPPRQSFTDPPLDEEPAPEVIVIGDEPPIDDKPAQGDEPAPDIESESDIAARESLKVLHEQLTSLGFSSVFDVVRDGRTEVLTKVKQLSKLVDDGPTEAFYEQAQARAASLTRRYAQLCARGEPALHAVLKLEGPEDRSWMLRSLNGGGNYASWFVQTNSGGFSHPDSAGSLFSPASYLTDLYRAAKPLHPTINGLQLNQRRPDLGQLTLSDANLNEEVSTLALTLEVLEAGIPGDVDEVLRTALYPMNLPYNHASEQILQGMAASKSSPAELWSVLKDYEGQALKRETDLRSWASKMPAAYARDALGMSPELLTILTEPFIDDFNAVGKYFGNSHGDYMFYESVLRDAVQLPTETILTALGAGPFNDAVSAVAVLEVDSSQTISFSFLDLTAQLTEMTVKVDRESGIVRLSFVPVSVSGSPISFLSFQLLVGSNTISPSPQAEGTARIWSFSTGITITEYLENPPAIRVKAQDTTKTLTSDPIAIRNAGGSFISPQIYGARYINGWDENDNPFYWYIGPALGQPVTRPVNDPASSLLYNRTNAAFGRLNRLIRLQRHVKVLSFEELDWLISQASENIATHPLTQPLQALAVYLPLRQRYGMTVNSFAACLGVLNTFHAPGKPSFYTSLFGEADLIDMPAVDFLQTTLSQTSLRARASLCQGLKVDDATLVLLAQYLPGISANGVLPELGLEQISALYRLVAIPRLFGLSVAQALHLWDLLAAPEAIVRALAQPKPNQVALGVLIRTGYLVDWMRTAQLDPEQLIALTSRHYPVQSTPELQTFIENIYSTLAGRTAATVSDDAVLRAQLARHIGAEFDLKPNIAIAAMAWADAVAKDMAATLIGYGLLSFWADIERVCQGSIKLDDVPRAVQYAYLLRQFAQVCHWAQLGEQDLQVLMPAGGGQPSALTGALTAPQLTLDVLLLLSRYRSWQRRLKGTVAEARSFIQRAAAQDPALTLQAAAQQISDLHGWDLTQTLVLINDAVPRNFLALLPLLQKMQFCQRLGLSPTDLQWVGKLTETATVDQATLTLIAAKVIAAAHG